MPNRAAHHRAHARANTRPVRRTYDTVMPLVFLTVLALVAAAGMQFFREYRVSVEPRQPVVKELKFARTPVLDFAGRRIAILAVTYHPDPARRTVIVRDITANSLRPLRLGQRAFADGPVVQQLNDSHIVLDQAGQTIIISLPTREGLAAKARNLFR